MQLMHSMYSINCVISNIDVPCPLFVSFYVQFSSLYNSTSSNRERKNLNRTSISINYGLGMCIVLLTIMQPCTTKSNTIGWNSKGVPCATTPKGRSSSTQPCETQYAISEAIDSVVGIGVPSKYFDLPVLSLGSTATVTLNRAKRVNPQSTKKVRSKWSAGVRAPSANAAAAGARPKEI